MRLLNTLLIVAVLIMLTACPKSTEKTGDNTSSSTSSNTTETQAVTWGNMPDITFTSFDGQEGKVSDFAGKPIVVNFWAVWCHYCVKEMPMFDEVYKEHPGEFELLAFCVDDKQDPQGFFASKGWSFTPVFDNAEGFKNFTDGSIPVTVFVDRNGNMVHRAIGEMTHEDFKANLEKILAK